MNGKLFLVTAFVNLNYAIKTHLDGGCQPYGLIEDAAARRIQLERLKLDRPVSITGYEGASPSYITEVAIVDDIDIGGSYTK
jgi:hypothetical protein